MDILRYGERKVREVGDDKERVLELGAGMLKYSYFTIFGEVLWVAESLGFDWNEAIDILEASAGSSSILKDGRVRIREREWEADGVMATQEALDELGKAQEYAAADDFRIPLCVMVCQNVRYMNFSKKYKTFAGYATVGMLERWIGKTPEDYQPVDEDKKEEYAKALCNMLIGTTTYIAAEAVKFCLHYGVDEEALVNTLVENNCATGYLSDLLDGTLENDITIGELKDSLSIAIKQAKDNNFFVAVLTNAYQLLNGDDPDRDYDDEAPLGSIVTDQL